MFESCHPDQFPPIYGTPVSTSDFADARAARRPVPDSSLASSAGPAHSPVRSARRGPDQHGIGTSAAPKDSSTALHSTVVTLARFIAMSMRKPPTTAR